MKRTFLTFALSAVCSLTMVSAQEGQKSRDAGKEKMITGCLSKQGAETYVFSDEKSGESMRVMGSTDLEKHSANHKVRLTGTVAGEGTDKMFHVTKIEHISTSCQAKK